MNFVDGLEGHGNRPALMTGVGDLSYAELASRSDAFVRSVREGLPDGVARPLILLEAANEIDSVIAYVGALRARWPVILVARGGAGRESRIARTYRPNVIVRAADGWLPVHADADAVAMHPDLAVLLSTSGTTGTPKLVRLSRRNLVANAESIAGYLGVTPDDRAITLLPFHYSYGMSVLHIHLMRGAGIVLTEGSLMDRDLRALAHRKEVTSLALVPTQFELLDETCWLPKLRYITQAGGRLDPLLAKTFAAKAAAEGWDLFIMYGQTEAGPRMSYVPPRDAQAWSHTIGRPIEGGSFRLMDAAGVEIGNTDRTGELIYEGPNVMLGYAETRADLGTPAGPSVLATGDMAERLENGYFRITGRTSWFVKLFGLRIGLDEVETQLRAEGLRIHVCGSDERLVVFARDDPDTEALRSRIAERYALPPGAVAVVPIDTVPVLPSGKVDYRILSRRAEALRRDAAPRHDMQALLLQALRTPELDLDRSFLEMGGDSLAYLEVQMHLLEVLGRVPDGWETLTLREILTLEGARPQGGAGAPAAFQAVHADLLARVAAIVAVIALHSTAWPTGGGAYLLLILAGYSLAKFQSARLFEGSVVRTWRSMLVPILACYYLLIVLAALMREPVGLEWFLLLGNFQSEISFKGLIPYWFVSAYVQIIVLFTLPFLLPAIRRIGARHPFGTGLAALAIVLLAGLMAGIDDIPPQLRHRHPLAALELLTIGWCVFFAKDAGRKALMTAVAGGVWWFIWRDVSPNSTVFILTGTIAVLWNFRLHIPSVVARWLMWVGSLTLFLYVAHVPVISMVWPLAPHSDLLRFGLVMLASICGAAVLKWLYDRTTSVPDP